MATTAATAPKKAVLIDNNRNIYMKSMLTTRVLVPMLMIDVYISQHLERKIRENVEGKCIAEGFVRPNSVKVISHSAGVIKNGDVEFTVVYECFVCHPVEGMNVDFIVKTITKAGIHGYVEDTALDIKPIIVFIARDHHYASRYFSKINEGDKVTGKIFGVNFQLNDQHIYVVAELKPPPRVATAAPQRGGGGGGKLSNTPQLEDDDDDDDEDDDIDDDDE